MNKHFYLDKLNDKQKKAVETLNGPVLVLAGAGTGKTRVLTTRLAHLLNKKLAKPWEILAVTFTNKAANEMKERVQNLLKIDIERMWIGTFHSSGLKILRRHAELCFLKRDFTVIDTDDQARLIKQILESNKIDVKKYTPSNVLWMIQWFKDKAILPEESKKYKFKFGKTLNISKLYIQYQERLKILNAVDFGDLLLLPVKIFRENLEILKKYQNQFKYILVDEYQDTNFIQSKWLNLLANKHKNICCVGDDDQSIYSWRGAEIKNFLNFDKIFKNTKKFKLEQNYRSTQNILSTASVLISNNQDRLGKNLWTDGEKGELVKLNCYKNGKDEAINISDVIEKKLKKNFSYNNIAILVRAIFQTREFEERFLKIGVGYRIVGGTKFYVRSEIKDSVAYLRIIFQKKDDLAFERIVNTPKRSVGDTTIKQISEYAKKYKLCLEDASLKMIEMNEIKPKAKIGLLTILNLISKWRKDLFSKKQVELMQIILDESGYSEMLKNKKDIESEGRLENIKELLRGMREFENLESFLEHVALATSIDEDWEGKKINLMTMHAAKGLEFDIVFLPGWEEGLFPHQKSLEEKGDLALEEERRLAYVAITRAKKRAYISFSMNRFYQGDWIENLASRFIDELPKENIKKNNVTEENIYDFEFNQDISYEKEIRSPGWLRLQKKLNEKK